MCGASVRAVARFCPHCGGEFFARERDADADVESESVDDGPSAQGGDGSPRTGAPTGVEHVDGPNDSARGAALPLREQRATPPTREHDIAAFDGADESPKDVEARVYDDETRDDEAGGDDAGGDAGAGEGRRVRAAARVREVKQNLKPRVEKMREDALVVLDETPDDAGLRFVVIAALLFVLFVVFLILSLYVVG